MKTYQYVIVTPARDEERYIEQTIMSIVSQSQLPRRWVIVNDGSRDRTAEIVKGYTETFPFIELINVWDGKDRDFGSKAKAFKLGYDQLRNVDYDFVGNLDADVTLGKLYYEEVVKRFAKNERLGIAGGVILERVGERLVRQKISLNSVAGAIQLFRRECYEAIGGYIDLKYGGIDAAAEIMARAKGWLVRTFPELEVVHHRRVATGGRNAIETQFLRGYTNYLLGYHPLFQLFSSLYRCGDRPLILGCVSYALGYCFAFLKGRSQQLPKEAVQYLRSEQLKRLQRRVTGRKGS